MCVCVCVEEEEKLIEWKKFKRELFNCMCQLISSLYVCVCLAFLGLVSEALSSTLPVSDPMACYYLCHHLCVPLPCPQLFW